MVRRNVPNDELLEWAGRFQYLATIQRYLGDRCVALRVGPVEVDPQAIRHFTILELAVMGQLGGTGDTWLWHGHEEPCRAASEQDQHQSCPNPERGSLAGVRTRCSNRYRCRQTPGTCVPFESLQVSSDLR